MTDYEIQHYPFVPGATGFTMVPPNQGPDECTIKNSLLCLMPDRTPRTPGKSIPNIAQNFIDIDPGMRDCIARKT